MARLLDDASTEHLSNTNGIVTAVPLSIGCRFYIDDKTPNFEELICITDTALPSNFFRLQWDKSDDLIKAVTKQNGGSAYAANSTASPSLTTWHTGLAVFAATNDRRVYLDGGNKGTDGNTSTPSGIDKVLIGALQSGAGAPQNSWSGRLAEVAIWNSALTDADAAIHGLGYSPLLIRPQSLVAYWQLHGNLSPEIDRVGGYDMTLNGSPTKAAHPRVIYPDRHVYRVPGAADDVAANINIAPSGNYVQVA